MDLFKNHKWFPEEREQRRGKKGTKLLKCSWCSYMKPTLSQRQVTWRNSLFLITINKRKLHILVAFIAWHHYIKVRNGRISYLLLIDTTADRQHIVVHSHSGCLCRLSSVLNGNLNVGNFCSTFLFFTSSEWQPRWISMITLLNPRLRGRGV